jgi:hypothetical protein
VVPPSESRYDRDSYPKEAFDKPKLPVVNEPAKDSPPLPGDSTKPPPIGQKAYAVPPVEFTGPLSNPRDDGFLTNKPAVPAIAQTVAKIKDCPWSLRVDLVDGQTVVVATVNKRHEFKIVCKHLDLQTGSGMLKATGNVNITGDAFNGACEQLSIPLMEDRLILEGGALVTIQKSQSRSDAFELKGASLNLRISEMHTERFQQAQTSMRLQSTGDIRQASATVPVPDKKWTPFGTLRRANTKVAGDTNVWQLEDRSGKVITMVLARVGGTLTQHEGQTISVIGSYEVIEGQRYLRVTHIALP